MKRRNNTAAENAVRPLAPCTLDAETRELLTRAAQAARIKIVEWVGDQANVIMPNGNHCGWNPLASWGGGEAMELAVKLRIAMFPTEGGGWDCTHFDATGRERVLASCANGGAWALQEAIVQAAAKLAPDAGVMASDELQALELLDRLFTAYEDGADVYEDPDEQAGHLGHAVKLDDATFHACADLLNRRRPRGVAPSASAQHWRGLTKDEIDHAVGELVEYGTDFVAPLYSVVEGIERKLRERNAGVTAAPAPSDAVWEALQRLIENGLAAGPASAEDARTIMRWRAQFVPAREPASGVGGNDGR